MIAKVKDLTAMIDKRVLMIESNKTADCSNEEILKVNTDILNQIKKGLERLKKESCNNSLIERYTKIVENVTL